MCRSVPQMEATFTLTRTSVRPKTGILTSRISAPGAASGLTTASMVLGMVWVRGNRVKINFSTSIEGHLFSSPSATARTLNPDAFPRAEPHIEFARQLFHRTVPPEDGCVPRQTNGTSSKPPRSAQAPVGKKCDFGASQDFDFAYDAVAAAVPALAPASGS